MHTGDLAVMDADGYLNIVGRIKDMIIRGGENVYPREIEEFLYTHPDIVDVQVIGVPDREVRRGDHGVGAGPRGRRRSPATTSRAFCAGRIAHYKVPRYVHVTDEFPMTVTGKVQKYLMRQEAIELLGLHDAAAEPTRLEPVSLAAVTTPPDLAPGAGGGAGHGRRRVRGPAPHPAAARASSRTPT